MMRPGIVLLLLVFLTFSCESGQAEEEESKGRYSPGVRVSGAMKNVMWKGELAGTIDLDSLKGRKGMYGLGPVEYLRGELLINDGRSFVSTVQPDSSMQVEETFLVKAPFFVYAQVTEWEEEVLPENISSIAQLEAYLDQKTKNATRPFAFKLAGLVDSAHIHVQNLAEGSQVSSPKEAHQGQVDYTLGKQEVEIVGFFSTEHKGVFTHHDSFLHMHLITADQTQMGHLDKVALGKMKLYLPKP